MKRRTRFARISRISVNESTVCEDDDFILDNRFDRSEFELQTVPVVHMVRVDGGQMRVLPETWTEEEQIREQTLHA